MRTRGAGVLIKENKVILIKRVREGTTYYVFPGGGIEEDETPEAAAKREAFEELGVNIEIKECISVVEFNGVQFFFLGEIIEGNIGTGRGEEYANAKRDRGTYQPMWVEINALSTLDVRPKEVGKRLPSLFH